MEGHKLATECRGMRLAVCVPTYSRFLRPHLQAVLGAISSRREHAKASWMAS